MGLDKEYKKYKWFFTYSEKLVIGGKSAKQNDELLKNIQKTNKDYFLMHTSTPGSPFSVILSDINKVTKNDLEECAIFTGCFSRAWKQGKKKTEVHIFKSGQIKKEKNMKSGTWRVIGKIKRVGAELKLVLVKQKKVLRAIPEKSARKKDILLRVCPGKIDKSKMILKFATELENDFRKEELMSALPAGGVKICK